MAAGGSGQPAAGQGRKGDKGSVRTALAGLTTRGRSFLAAGIAAAVCAYVLGQPDLLRVGLLLAALPLICAAVAVPHPLPGRRQPPALPRARARAAARPASICGWTTSRGCPPAC